MTASTTVDRTAELHRQLAEKVEALTTSEDWAAMLATSAKFHRYSPNNVLLMLAQRPQATGVAGFKAWQGMGRQVRKGEKGIAILAPCGGPCRSCAGAGHHHTDRSLTCGRCGGSGRWTNFRPAYVFDIAQTDGEDLAPTIRPTLIEGEAPAGLLEALAAQVAAAGFSLVYGPPSTPGANGTTEYLSRTVTVRADVSDAQKAKTLAHELAHVLLHDGTSSAMGCRGRVEVEAESVAYIVAAASGLATEGYSLPYVAHWSGGDTKVVATTAERVIRCAGAILAAMAAPAVEAVAA